jgi:hypothetical protein
MDKTTPLFPAGSSQPLRLREPRERAPRNLRPHPAGLDPPASPSEAAFQGAGRAAWVRRVWEWKLPCRKDHKNSLAELAAAFRRLFQRGYSWSGRLSAHPEQIQTDGLWRKRFRQGWRSAADSLPLRNARRQIEHWKGLAHSLSHPGRWLRRRQAPLNPSPPLSSYRFRVPLERRLRYRSLQLLAHPRGSSPRPGRPEPIANWIGNSARRQQWSTMEVSRSKVCFETCPAFPPASASFQCRSAPQV